MCFSKNNTLFAQETTSNRKLPDILKLLYDISYFNMSTCGTCSIYT